MPQRAAILDLPHISITVVDTYNLFLPACWNRSHRPHGGGAERASRAAGNGEEDDRGFGASSGACDTMRRMVPPRAHSSSSRVPALIIHGGAGADPGGGRVELRAAMGAAIAASCASILSRSPLSDPRPILKSSNNGWISRV